MNDQMTTSRKTRNFRILLLLAVAASITALRAQIPDVEVEIINPLKVTLPFAERNFDKVPVTPLAPVYPPLEYQYRQIPFTAPPFTAPVRPLKLKTPEQETPTRGYVTLGYGNYGAPLADVFFPLSKLSNGKTSAGIRAFHNSFLKGPVEGKASASGTTSLTADFKRTGDAVSTEGLISFRNNYTGYYGYPEGTKLKRDTIAQAWNTLSAALLFSNTRKSDYNFQLRTGLSHLWNKYSAAETEVNLDYQSSLSLTEKTGLNLNASYVLLSREDSKVEPKPRHLFKGTLSYVFNPRTDIRFEAGARFAYENDTLVKSAFHLYPVINATWSMRPRVTLTASVTGDMDKVSLQTLSSQNAWLAENVALSHTNNLLNIDAAIRAAATAGLSLFAGVRYGGYADLYFFSNVPTRTSRFEVVYDDARMTGAYAGFSLQKGKATLNLRGDYFGWSVSGLEAPFHRPRYKAELDGSFTVAGRLLVRPYAIVLGGIQAPGAQPGAVVTLPAATDLGVRTDFHFSERGSVLLRLTNILSSKYALYQYYQVRGFQVMAGLTWKF